MGLLKDGRHRMTSCSKPAEDQPEKGSGECRFHRISFAIQFVCSECLEISERCVKGRLAVANMSGSHFKGATSRARP